MSTNWRSPLITTLTRGQIEAYLIAVREVSDLALHRFGELRSAAASWCDHRAVIDARLDLEAHRHDDTLHAALVGQPHEQFAFFAATEAFLAAWARLSLLFFPIGDGAHCIERGRVLRICLDVSNDSALKNRCLRDNWMHFDERLSEALHNGSYKRSYWFCRSGEAHDFITTTLLVLELDTLVLRSRTRKPESVPTNLHDLGRAVQQVRDSLNGTIAGSTTPFDKPVVVQRPTETSANAHPADDADRPGG